MTKRDAMKLVREWKKTLRLQDWEVILDFQTREEMPNELACVKITPERKVLRISIRWPHKNNHNEPENLESTIIHELIHCHFDPIYPGHPEKRKHEVVILEQGIDLLAEALYTVKHKKESQ